MNARFCLMEDEHAYSTVERVVARVSAMTLLAGFVFRGKGAGYIATYYWRKLLSKEALWQSGLMRKTRNLVPSGASVRIRPMSNLLFWGVRSYFFCSFFWLSLVFWSALLRVLQTFDMKASEQRNLGFILAIRLHLCSLDITTTKHDAGSYPGYCTSVTFMSD